MKIRKIKENEIIEMYKLSARCFNFSVEGNSSEEFVNQQLSNPSSFVYDHLRNQYVCVDDYDKIMAKIRIGMENTNFDGNKVPTGLISGVSTSPEYRRMGCIREIFEYILPMMYNEGVLVSQLFPFSQRYYRNFGYEMCAKELEYKWRLESLPDYKYKGSFVPAGTSAHVTDVQKIYSAYSENFSFAMDRSRYNFFHDFKNTEKSAKDRIYTSIYYDTDKKPVAYFTSNIVYSEEINYVEITDIAFTSIDGLKAILSFVKHAYIADCLQLRMRLPDFFDLSTFIPENRSVQPYNSVECKIRPMVRIVNVKEILKKAKYNGTGKLAITIEDKQIPQNHGIFTVEFENGKAVSVEHQKDGVSDVFMPINMFSRLIIGDLEPKDIAWLDSKQIKYACSLEKLGKVFFKKPIMVSNYF